MQKSRFFSKVIFWEKIVMEHDITITLHFKLTTGKANLYEIMYKLKELRESLMLKILEKIMMVYDNEKIIFCFPENPFVI